MSHNSFTGGKDNETELSRRKNSSNPFFNVFYVDVETGSNSSDLVESSSELDNDLASLFIIDEFEFPNVSLQSIFKISHRELALL